MAPLIFKLPDFLKIYRTNLPYQFLSVRCYLHHPKNFQSELKNNYFLFFFIFLRNSTFSFKEFTINSILSLPIYALLVMKLLIKKDLNLKKDI